MPEIPHQSDGVEQVIDLEASPVEPTHQRRQWLQVAIIAVVGIALIGGIAVWRAISAFGAPDASIHAMPAFTDVYMNVDLKVFLDTDIDRLATTFPDLFDDPESAEQQIMDDIVRPFNEELGLDFDTDVSPWLARSIGIGMWNVDALTENLASLLGTETTGPRPESDRFTMVAAIANRDSEAAPAALEKLASQSDAVPDDPIAGNAVWRFASQEPGDESLSGDWEDTFGASYFTISGDLGLISNTRHGLETAMAVQAGEVASLQENEAYRDTIRLLPNGPGTIFGYASADVFAAYGNVLEDLGSIVGSPGGLDATQVSGIGGMAGSFAINEEGLRFDVAQTWDPEFSDQVGGSTRFVSNDSITSRIPGDALGYVAYVVETEDSVWDMIASTYESTYEDQLQLDPIDVMLVNLESEMGVRPGSIERFVRSLGTGFGFYVGGDTVPSDVVVDMTALVMLADPAAAEAALSDLVVPFEGPELQRTHNGWTVLGTVDFGVVDDFLT